MLAILLLLPSFLSTLLFPSANVSYTSTATGASVTHVTNSDTLQQALQDAQPGDRIQLADGVYNGTFTANVSGTAAAPITLQGSRRAVLNGSSIKRGYAFHLQADYWVLRGFTVTNAQKGIMADGANGNVLDGLRVFEIGHEAIHFRAWSTHNTVQNCDISDTGVVKAGFGEGVYPGSAQSNWAKYSNGQPDASDANRVLNNHFGPNVRAEAIDIKEGTSGGEVRGNVFDGTGMSGANFADSWVDVKGNNYVISDNRGAITQRDGFQTHRILDGWGRDNHFRNNVAVQASGYAIWIHLDGTDAAGNIVYSDNRATQAQSGIANVPLTPHDGTAPQPITVPPTPASPPAWTPTPRPLPSPPPAASERTASTCDVAFEITNQWKTGYTARVTITNTGAMIQGWTLQWNVTDGARVVRAWDAQVTQRGTTVTATNAAWNATLAPQASVNFGMKVSGNAATSRPQNFQLNDVICE